MGWALLSLSLGHALLPQDPDPLLVCGTAVYVAPFAPLRHSLLAAAYFRGDFTPLSSTGPEDSDLRGVPVS